MITTSKSISIIAPKYLHRRILLKKPKNIGVKLFTKQDVMKLFLGTYDELDILQMAKDQKLSYEEMSTYAEFMPFVKKATHFDRTKKLQRLASLYPTKKDDLGQKIFKNKECHLYGYDNLDRDLMEILNDRDIVFIFHKLKDDNKYICHSYEDKRIEIGEVFNRICDELKRGTKANLITLVAPTDYTIDILLYSSLFNLEFKISGCSYFQTSDGQKMITALREDRLETFEVIDELKDLKQEILALSKESFSKELLISYLIRILKKNTVSTVSKGINLVTSFDNIIDASKLFVIGFNNSLIKPHNNSQYISDIEIKNDAYGLECYEKDMISERNLWNVLSQVTNPLITYSSVNSSGSYQLPTLHQENKIVVTQGLFFQRRYSKEFDQLTFSMLLEDYNNYGSNTVYLAYLRSILNDVYDTYNPQYSGEYNSNQKQVLAATSIALYSKCPFAYYLKKILKIKEDFDLFNMQMGTLAHKMIELDCDYTDPRIQAMIDEFNFSIKDKFYAKLKLKSMETMRKILRRTREHFVDYSLSHEVKKEFEYDVDTKIIGYIDYVLNNDNSYIIFDFKSSKKAFNRLQLYFGFDVQLMLYLKLMEPSYTNIPLGAFFVPLFSSKSYIVSEKEFKYSGYLIDKVLTSEIMGDDFKTTFSVSKNGDVKSNEGFVQDLEYLDTVIKNTVDGIRSNNFKYTPLRLRGNALINSCNYCNFGDICFYRKRDIRYLVKPDDISASETEEETNDE